MLIVNADDYGQDRTVTDRILTCYGHGRISSTSAMVFMADSERAAGLALECGIEVGLHLNLTDPFTGEDRDAALVGAHQRVSAYYARRRLAMVLYSPMVRKEVGYTLKRQWDRFVELYGRPPSHVDGHRHRHLSPNVLMSGVIPEGARIRRNHHFEPGEKSPFNLLWRAAMDVWLTRRYLCTDRIYSLKAPRKAFEDPGALGRLARIVALSRERHVELMTHPGVGPELAYLLSAEFRDLLEQTTLGRFSMLGASRSPPVPYRKTGAAC